MKLRRIFVGRGLFFIGQALAASLALTGCNFGEQATFSSDVSRNSALTGPQDAGAASVAAETGRFRIGDQVMVKFSPNSEELPPHEEQIPEDGNITLHLVGPVKAVGKTMGELQKEIHDAYVPKYFVRLTVTVTSQQQSYSVGGEVKVEGPKFYIGETTLTKAIQAAGGFTDFANKKKIQVTRNKKTITFNWNTIQKKPSTNPLIIPGDSIHVPRRWPG